jgi:hypothetical protein
LLVIAIIAIPVHAAPRLKDKKPSPGSEEARVEELRAKYDRLRTSGTDAERLELAGEEGCVRALIRLLDKIALQPPSQQQAQKAKSIVNRIESYGLRKDLYDIAIHDRKKAGGEN